jgi:hypothetical protein
METLKLEVSPQELRILLDLVKKANWPGEFAEQAVDLKRKLVAALPGPVLVPEAASPREGI